MCVSLSRYLLVVALGIVLLLAWTSAESSESEPPTQPVEQNAEEESPQSSSEEIAENLQTALSLKRLLLGRSYLFFGRIEGEAAMYSDRVFDGENGFQIRRLRVGLAGVLSDNLSYKGELDLTDTTATLSDFYLKWDTPRAGSLAVGNQRVTQNLSAMTGTLSLLFMEHPLPITTFSLARRVGVSYDQFTKRWGGHAMLFGGDVNNDAGDRGWAIRAIMTPERQNAHVTHFGLSLVREKMDGEARYRTRPESDVTDIRLVDTGQFYDVDYQNILGLEFAGARGAFSGRVELIKSWWERADDVKNDFYGAYLELGYFLTGQGFNYQRGRFMRPEIGAGAHAWEVGVRASWVDLNDRDVQGGEQLNLGLAVNWYLSRRLRLQGNLLYATTDEVAGDISSWIFQGRMQFNW